ncbi:hypothetical protein KUTeg_024232 [Tegillarca granosa]|uniref:Uncharacterized protein n=1 Tax=Tegillarca granosa TaxID=220873 RepID=A0ABQ9E1V6_TEGGR|nr:hypothetical protein KUTeg_024232 [Tegillarca granosa]
MDAPMIGNVMDFDTVENWGVEKTASDLDKSLFGALNGITGNKKKTKKRKLKTEQVIDYSSPIKKSKTETSLDKISQSDSVIHDTDDKNLSKNRKKHLKNKQRKLMKKNQKMQKKDGEKTYYSSMQNDYINNKFTNKKLDRKENKSIKNKNKKSIHDQDAGNKGKEVFKENQIVIGEKDKNKGSLNKKEKVKNRTNKKSFSKLENVTNMQGLSCGIKKVKADAKSHVENPSGNDNKAKLVKI